MPRRRQVVTFFYFVHVQRLNLGTLRLDHPSYTSLISRLLFETHHSRAGRTHATFTRCRATRFGSPPIDCRGGTLNKQANYLPPPQRTPPNHTQILLITSQIEYCLSITKGRIICLSSQVRLSYYQSLTTRLLTRKHPSKQPNSASESWFLDQISSKSIPMSSSSSSPVRDNIKRVSIERTLKMTQRRHFPAKQQPRHTKIIVPALAISTAVSLILAVSGSSPYCFKLRASSAEYLCTISTFSSWKSRLPTKTMSPAVIHTFLRIFPRMCPSRVTPSKQKHSQRPFPSIFTTWAYSWPVVN